MEQGKDYSAARIMDLLGVVISVLHDAQAVPRHAEKARGLLMAMEALRAEVAGCLVLSETVPGSAARVNPSPSPTNPC